MVSGAGCLDGHWSEDVSYGQMTVFACLVGVCMAGCGSCFYGCVVMGIGIRV